MNIGPFLFSTFSILGLIFYVAVPVFTVYVVVMVLKRMRERNEYLKDIRDELRKRNDTSN